MSATSLPFLKTLKAAQLKRLAFLIGTNTTGTKPILVSCLESDLLIPRLQRQSPNRILSIDMGIRNLAYCILDAPTSENTGTKGKGKQSIKVIAWKRIAVSKTPLPTPASSDSPSPSSASLSLTSPSPLLAREKQVESSTESFHPALLARTAHTLLTTHLLPYNPTAILIERQRYRSGGGSAVQEWTVRVNMFESIIYGVLETLRQAHQSHQSQIEGREKPQARRQADGEGRKAQFPEVWDVNPKRVAEFWLRGDGGSEDGFDGLEDKASEGVNGAAKEKGIRKRKIEKKEKISLVGSWLSHDSAATSSPTPHLSFTDEASRTRDAFMEKQNRRSGSKASMQKTKAKSGMLDVVVPVVDVVAQSEGSEVEVVEEMESEKKGKLDDLADCLLQGVAWVRWEGNRREILDSARRAADGAGETATPRVAGDIAKPDVTGENAKHKVTAGRDPATRPKSRPKRYMD